MIIKSIVSHFPINRLPIYAAVIGLIPVLFIIIGHFSKVQKWDEVIDAMEQLRVELKTINAKQAVNQIVRKEYSPSDPAFIHEKIESIACLELEKMALEKLFEKPSCQGNDATLRRHAYLAGSENRIQFSETSSFTFDGVRETLLPLLHPVEIDSDNLKNILFQIDQKQLKQPLLIIKDFSLERKKYPSESEVFVLSMTLIKREFDQ